jgi:hypothetical protein
MKSSRSLAVGIPWLVGPCALIVAGFGMAVALACMRSSGATSGAAAPPASLPVIDVRALDAKVRLLLNTHGDGIRASIWVGGSTGGAWYAWQPDEVRPAASAIKTSFLVEFFARYADALDRPPPGLEDVLREGHPAFAHYSLAERKEVRDALSGFSVRRLGQVMMGSVPASDIVYNAAANVVIALWSGPEGLTKAIRARDAAFAPIAVRRYMLARRDVTGDNEATASALAAVLQRLASGQVPGVAKATTTDLRQAVLVKDVRGKGRYHSKNGDLDSDPLARIHSGWLETPRGRVVVYAVMTTQPNPGSLPRDKAGERLEKTVERLTETVLDAVLEGGEP